MHVRYIVATVFASILIIMPINQARMKWMEVMDYITKHTEVNEVILSGGDPLSLNNKRLKLWLDKITAIGHIRTVRLHTRLPVVLP